MRVLAVVLLVTVGCTTSVRYRMDPRHAGSTEVAGCFARCDRLVESGRSSCYAACPAVVFDQVPSCAPGDVACRISQVPDPGATATAVVALVLLGSIAAFVLYGVAVCSGSHSECG